MFSVGHNYTVTGIQEDHLDNEPQAANGKAPFQNYCKFPHNFKKYFVYLSLFHWIPATLDFLFNIVYFGLIIVCDTV